ncbi:MAG: hypothetical protein IKK75_13105 [Clostridia bacterium]|nr:hypothetical protein [Clostridia bacterium]
MTEKKPIMQTTRRYGYTLYTISAYGNPESTSTYEERLLQLIRLEAEKRDSDKTISTTTTTENTTI